MGKEVESVLKFNKYIIKSINFEYNLDSKDDKFTLDFSLTPNFIELDDKSLVVELLVDVFKEKDKCYPFSLELEIVGFFTCENMDINSYKPNTLAILYPYVRSLVTNITANANVAPLILPTINTNRLIYNIDE